MAKAALKGTFQAWTSKLTTYITIASLEKSNNGNYLRQRLDLVMSQVNNSRILKNTAFLYMRMLLGLIVSLITARVIFDALGVVDYGLNDVVGGMISLFSFINGSLASSTSRFLAYSLGKDDETDLSKVFSNAFLIHFSFAIIVVILGETLGLYFVNNILNIPENRLFACNALWQAVICGSAITLVMVPFSSLLISYERMSIYAYIGMFDIIARLLIVYLVKYSPFDKLISLAILNLVVSILVFLFYHWYCRIHFASVVSYSLKRDKEIQHSMLGFTGWSVIGSLANMLRHSGLNILLNLFFGPVANAANAIAFRVNNAIMGFTTNFTTAVNPQITKSYAAGEHEAMKKLIFRAGKMTYYLLLLLCFPVLFECGFILHLWLGESVPASAIIMTRLVLVISMVETFNYSIGCAVQATGKIKYYQIVISGISLLIFPLSWGLFKMGSPVYTGLVVYLACSVISLFVRLYFIDTLLHISPIEYVCKVLIKVGLVTIASLIFPVLFALNVEESGIRCMLMIVLVEFVSIIAIWSIGLDHNERDFIKSLTIKKLRRDK